MARYRMTAARKSALRKAQLISARKRKGKSPRKTVSVVKSGGVTYRTENTRGLLVRSTVTHYTKAYRGAEMLGYAQTVSNTRKKTASVDDLYVRKDYRGTGLSKKIMQQQAKTVKGQKVSITHLRSIGGDKAAQRIKIRGLNPTVKTRRSNPDSITNTMEFAWAIQSGGHEGMYKREQKKMLRGKKIRNKVPL